MPFYPLIEKLELEKAGLEALLIEEFHPKRLQYLLDKLYTINNQIRNEKRKYIF